MYREKIVLDTSKRIVQVEENKLKRFGKETCTETSFRLYDDGYAGIQYVRGRADEETAFRQATDNLSLRRPYKFTPETGSRHRDKTEAVYTDRELMDIAHEIMEYLNVYHSEFSFSGDVVYTNSTKAMQNDYGLDYSDTDGNVATSFHFKHKDSKDIVDGVLNLSQRKFEIKKFTDMADNFLSNFTSMVELPEELIVQQQYYGLLDKLYESLDAEKIALGTSVLSGKVGKKVFADSFTVAHDVSDKYCWRTPFFDGEGVVNPDDRHVYIKNGVVLSGYADKYTADKYGVPHTGSASTNMNDIPLNGNVNLHIDRSEKKIKELLDGRLCVVPILASGGGFNDRGDYVTPVQTAMLCDGERFIGRLPGFTMKTTLFDMFGKDFIGVGSDDVVFNDKTVLVRMSYGK